MIIQLGGLGSKLIYTFSSISINKQYLAMKYNEANYLIYKSVKKRTPRYKLNKKCVGYNCNTFLKDIKI